MADAWHGPTLSDETLTFGPLALIAPLLQRLDIAAIIDRHLPPDPQLAFSHGRILSLTAIALKNPYGKGVVANGFRRYPTERKPRSC
jgi:hypothetical protein